MTLDPNILKLVSAGSTINRQKKQPYFVFVFDDKKYDCLIINIITKIMENFFPGIMALAILTFIYALFVCKSLHLDFDAATSFNKKYPLK